MKAARAALLLLLLPLAARADRPVPILPGLGPDARRVLVDRDARPWRAVGRVQTELGERCTGFLLTPTLVATAGHCVYLPRVRHDIVPRHVHFLRGVELDSWRAHAAGVRLAVPPGYDPLREGETMALDRAFLTLDHPAGDGTDLLRIASRMPPPGTALVLGGYGQDREEHLTADLHCHLVDVTAGLIRHDCAATRGTSGAPLLVETAPGEWRVIGIEVAAYPDRPGGFAASLVPDGP